VCRAPKGPRKHLIVTRASIHGFLVFDWWHRRSEALQRLSRWHRTGHIRFKEDVLEGIEYMPEGFLRLLQGRNFGKQLIKISWGDSGGCSIRDPD